MLFATIITILIFMIALLLTHCIMCIVAGSIAYKLKLDKSWFKAVKKAFQRF